MQRYFAGMESNPLVARAVQTCADLSRAEQAVGFVSPEKCALDVHLRTAIIALATAIEMAEWKTAAEAFVTLVEAEWRVREEKA